MRIRRLSAAALVPVALMAVAVTSPEPRNGASLAAVRDGPLSSELPGGLRRSRGPARYVSPEGSDRGPGSATAPWRTIQHGVEEVRPGSVLVVRPGRYHETVEIERGGTRRRPVTIRGRPGAILLPRPGIGNRIPLKLGDGAHHIRIENLVIEGATGPATANIYARGGAHHIDIVGCLVRNSQRQGLFSERTTRHIRVVRSVFRDNGGGGGENLDHNLYLEGSHHLLAGSVVTAAPNGYGVQVYPVAADVVIASNTIVGNAADGVIVGGDGDGAASGVRIVNNVIVGNGRHGVSSYWTSRTGAGNLVHDNLVWGNGGSQLTGDGLAFGHNIEERPEFVDPARSDFRLRESSPAGDAALAAYTLSKDLRDVRRPQGEGPDVGAYETQP